ncbi:hypothetical protein RDI58_006632 [Solanum bulbocastanum]|uniref:Uncharacterized protein n=1 Tax=Solanum bulbocastanum TaxID=147425 RepID=A0AAN8YH04_SOLBU
MEVETEKEDKIREKMKTLIRRIKDFDEKGERFSLKSGKFMETVVQETVKMVSLNLFRSRAPQPRENQVACRNMKRIRTG